ncbi:UNVERIFIED_CONTAM: hypothetical protein GTU68_050573 [Idotea baltica]|nr:hypothetical protein [Idotea baltica]
MNKLFAGKQHGSPAEPVAPTGDPEKIAQVETVLERLRPHFQADGGDIRLVRVDEFGYVELSMHGACNGCSASALTLRGAIEPELKAAYDWVEGVRTL